MNFDPNTRRSFNLIPKVNFQSHSHGSSYVSSCFYCFSFKGVYHSIFNILCPNGHDYTHALGYDGEFFKSSNLVANSWLGTILSIPSSRGGRPLSGLSLHMSSNEIKYS